MQKALLLQRCCDIVLFRQRPILSGFFNPYLRSLAIEKLHIDRFLEFGKLFPILDVRSPGEYNHAHIPGAYNLPLFSDEERKIVGTAYKQQGREVAIKLGLDFFGLKMRPMIETVESLIGSVATVPEAKQVLVHCWRGGMRSAGVAWLLDLYGFKVYTLTGGYKAYRHWIIETFSFPYSFHLLGGYTGSGKTHVLEELKKKGQAVINLEKLASHKGSAFGNIGMPGQPTQEMFENLLGQELRTCIKADAPVNGNGKYHPADFTAKQRHRIWLEDESQRIGDLNIPHTLWNTMWESPLVFITIPFEERVKHIVEEYGQLDRQRMANAIIRIKKRLGGLETKMALQYLEDGDIESCFRVLLKYYDKLYNKSLAHRHQSKGPVAKLDYDLVNAALIADKIAADELVIK